MSFDDLAIPAPATRPAGPRLTDGPETFAAAPTRRRKILRLTRRDLLVLELLVSRRVETLDALHQLAFPDVSRKRALNRLGELVSAGYLDRRTALLPGHDAPRSVYLLTKRAGKALEMRSWEMADWFLTRQWKLDLDDPSIPHQIVTNRVCDWLGAHAIPEHLLPPAARRGPDQERQHRPDAIYQAAQPDHQDRRLVLLEVDLGHYNRQRIRDKLTTALANPEARLVLFACPTPERQRWLIGTISETHGHHWDRIDVKTFTELKDGVAPGYPPNDDLRPTQDRAVIAEL